MKDLTREQLILEFRKMWNWIADETEKRQHIVFKDNYFKENGITNIPMNHCYLCQLCLEQCSNCPVYWGKDCFGYDIYCYDDDSPYELWLDAYDWEEATELAREIANLPLKEVK